MVILETRPSCALVRRRRAAEVVLAGIRRWADRAAFKTSGSVVKVLVVGKEHLQTHCGAGGTAKKERKKNLLFVAVMMTLP